MASAPIRGGTLFSALHRLLIFAALGILLAGCEKILTTPPPEGEAFDQPLPGLSREQNRAFARGDEAFEQRFSFQEGLGPIFNQPACESCHPSDGKGHPSSNLIRFGAYTNGAFDEMESAGGPQLQDRAMPGVSPETLPATATAVSRRSGPAVFGLGLIEAIPDSTILAHADPNDSNGDGISGRPNYVRGADYLETPAGPYGGKFLGRFGRKAGAPFLLQQIVTAYRQDMGISSDYHPVENPHPQAGLLGDDTPDPEVSSSTVNDVASYLRMLAPPRRGENTALVQQGGDVFLRIGCQGCHVPSMRTGTHPTIGALSATDVRLYSDLLLHDMGDALADGFWEGESDGREWRTTPLWGLRLYEEQLGGTAFYLHDGRTSDLGEAIRLHGGEAEQARNAFLALPPEEVEALLAFLKSL